MNIGELVAYLRLDNKDWDAKVKSSGKSLDKFGKIADGAFKAVASAAKVAFVAAGAAITTGIKAAISFERQMANVSTMLDTKTLPMMKKFSKGILDLSVEFGGSTDTLAKGLYDILSASVPAADAMSVLETSVKAAAAGMSDTGVAADVLTTLMNAFGDTADNVEHYADVLFQTIKSGKTTFDELASSVGSVAPIANAASVTVEEMAAMLAIMTRNGIDTATAATNLKGAITSMLKPTDEAVKTAESLGINFGAAALEADGFESVMKDVANLPPDVLVRLFPNVRGLMAVVSASGAMTKELAKYRKNLSEGSPMIDAFNKQTATSAFLWNQTKATFRATMIELGTKFLPMFNVAIKTVRNFVIANKDTILRVIQLTTIIAPVVLAITKFAAVLKSLQAIFVVTKVALLAFNAALVTSPMTLALGATLALVGGLTALFVITKNQRSAQKELNAHMESTATLMAKTRFYEPVTLQLVRRHIELTKESIAEIEKRNTVELMTISGMKKIVDLRGHDIIHHRVAMQHLERLEHRERDLAKLEEVRIEGMEELEELIKNLGSVETDRIDIEETAAEKRDRIEKERRRLMRLNAEYRKRQHDEEAEMLRKEVEDYYYQMQEKKSITKEFQDLQESTQEEIIDNIKERRDAYIRAGVDVLAAEKWAADEITKVQNKAADETERKWQEAYRKIEGYIKSTVTNLRDIFSSFFDWQQSMINANMITDINAAREKYDNDEEFLKKKAAIERDYAEKEYNLKKAKFAVDKIAALVKIAIDTAAAVVAALTAGPVIGPLLAVGIGVLGGIQAGLVLGTRFPPMPAYEGGGWVGGSSGVDENVIRASKGEYVMDRENASRNAGLLENMSAGMSVDITPGQAVLELDGYVIARAMIPYLEEEADKGKFRVNPRALGES